jgi:predicted P-loop ATPase
MIPAEKNNFKLKHDGEITIAVGQSRFAKAWHNKKMLWSDLVKRLSKTQRTGETMAEFLKLSKKKQDEIKDVGGFVGGPLKNGRRLAENAAWRQIVTLDADFAAEGLWDSLELFLGDVAVCAYSTHKHSEKKPRLRLVLPLSRAVTPDEYQAVSRKIASDIGIDIFDDTTYQPHRLMYWPSTAKDAQFFFEYKDGEWLDADEVLNSYDDWQDQSAWPVSSRTHEIIKREIKKQEDPLTKKGVIGAFCRTYTVQEAIEKFLPDVYEECRSDDRYTYLHGSSSGGAVVYDDKFLYSHHATDPCSLKLVNAFDLVRIHKFGALDEDAEYGTPVGKMPSYKAMREFAAEDKAVKILMGKEQLEEAQMEFEDESADWLGELKRDAKSGKIIESRYNMRLILENDAGLKESFAFEEFSGRIVLLRNLPWRTSERGRFWTDGDDAALRYHLETFYNIDNVKKLEDEVQNIANNLAFHAVRQYLNGLEWDGEKRLDTVLVDFLGAEDTPFVRAATRKSLLAAVGRIMQPGVKFDNMLVLVGRQGEGKSYLCKKLAKDWFSDSLTTVQGKEAFEQLRGAWIMEMPELAAIKKSEVEAIKAFISKQEDSYRVAYGRHTRVFPRQCIFIGTTNEESFLKDRTGSRRFWPVVVGGARKKDLWAEDIDAVIDQIWAEAVAAWNGGERLFIGKEMEKTAKIVQRQHTEDSPLLGPVQEYLEKELPKNWYELDVGTRREFIQGDGFDIDMTGAIKRERVCALEIWCELLGGDIKRFPAQDRREINEVMRQVKGWTKPKSKTGRLRFGDFYGAQKCYVRQD